MLRQIFKHFKLRNKELWIKNEQSINGALNLNNGKLRQFKFPSGFYTSSRLQELFKDHENIHAYKVLQKVIINQPETNSVTSMEELNETLNKHWRNFRIEEIVSAFLKVKDWCILNNIKISDVRFDKLVDGLMDKCEHVNDRDLFNLLYCIGEFPLEESYMAHNFHDLWSCLDDICCWKIIDWDIEKCFVVANAWYQLRLGKLCDFIFILIDRYVKRADRLTKAQLVNIYFYLNVCRRRPVDFEYEFALEKLINDMDIDEMAVVAMGYFKTKTKIKLTTIQEALAQRVMDNARTVDDISLTAILKILRYSKPLKLSNKIEDMTDRLYPEIDRLSDLCCTHLALLSTGIQVHNKNVFDKISNKFVKQMSNADSVRLKDIERMLNSLSMFNYDPKTDPDIFKASLDELSKRQEELIKYPRSLICALNYLSLRNVYSYDLSDRVLDSEYIDIHFGKGARSLPRELFSLDCSIGIECPDYKGNRLSSIRKYKSVKWQIEYFPTHDHWKKLTITDKLVLDVFDTVKSVVGDEKLLYVNHVLPHFSRADIILCKNKQSGKFVEPGSSFQNYVVGDVMVPCNDSFQWFALVILGWNNTIRDTAIPLGHSLMKERQLRKIGYRPVFILWKEFLQLSESMRKQYILGKLNI